MTAFYSNFAILCSSPASTCHQWPAKYSIEISALIEIGAVAVLR
jgi:hypothetical protein